MERWYALDGMRTLLHSVALEQLYLALVHDLAHADAQDLYIVILRIDARLLQQQTTLFSTEKHHSRFTEMCTYEFCT